jgi:hypothetical protein
MTLDEYITITEAAKILNKTVSMVGRICRAGKFEGAEKKVTRLGLFPAPPSKPTRPASAALAPRKNAYPASWPEYGPK